MMKTPLPEPVQAVCVMVSNFGSTHMTPKGNYYTSKQLRAAMVAAYEEGVEDAAKECEGMKVRAVRSSYEDAYRHAASAIRKLKEQTP